MPTIRVREHGPYLLEGDEVTLVDWHGVSYRVEKRPIALCRCGQSSKRPFCDGAHRAAGFRASESAEETGT